MQGGLTLTRSLSLTLIEYAANPHLSPNPKQLLAGGGSVHGVRQAGPCKLAIGGEFDTLGVYDVETRKLELQLPVDEVVYEIALSPEALRSSTPNLNPNPTLALTLTLALTYLRKDIWNVLTTQECNLGANDIHDLVHHVLGCA